MENATKALLIAASVLVVILIITLGVGLFNKANEQMTGADLSEYQIQQFNDKFTKFEGPNKSGSEVNAMIKAVFNHNNTQQDTSTMITLTDKTSSGVGITPSTTGSTTSPKKVSTNQRFSVMAKYDANSKLVTELVLQSAGTTTLPEEKPKQ